MSGSNFESPFDWKRYSVALGQTLGQSRSPPVLAVRDKNVGLDSDPIGPAGARSHFLLGPDSTRSLSPFGPMELKTFRPA